MLFFPREGIPNLIATRCLVFYLHSSTSGVNAKASAAAWTLVLWMFSTMNACDASSGQVFSEKQKLHFSERQFQSRLVWAFVINRLFYQNGRQSRRRKTAWIWRCVKFEWSTKHVTCLCHKATCKPAERASCLHPAVQVGTDNRRRPGFVGEIASCY